MSDNLSTVDELFDTFITTLHSSNLPIRVLCGAITHYLASRPDPRPLLSALSTLPWNERQDDIGRAVQSGTSARLQSTSKSAVWLERARGSIGTATWMLIALVQGSPTTGKGRMRLEEELVVRSEHDSSALAAAVIHVDRRRLQALNLDEALVRLVNFGDHVATSKLLKLLTSDHSAPLWGSIKDHCRDKHLAPTLLDIATTSSRGAEIAEALLEQLQDGLDEAVFVGCIDIIEAENNQERVSSLVHRLDPAFSLIVGAQLLQLLDIPTRRCLTQRAKRNLETGADGYAFLLTLIEQPGPIEVDLYAYCQLLLKKSNNIPPDQSKAAVVAVAKRDVQCCIEALGSDDLVLRIAIAPFVDQIEVYLDALATDVLSAPPDDAIFQAAFDMVEKLPDDRKLLGIEWWLRLGRRVSKL